MSNLATTPNSNRLVRSATDKRLAGVCGGIGEYFAVDPIIVRLLFVATLFAGVGFLIYPVLWLVMPSAVPGQGPTVINQPQATVQPSAGARFDPMTGRPLVSEAPRFDPYTGQPLPQDETVVPIVNASVNQPATAQAGSLTPQERRRRLFGMGMIGLGIFVVGNGILHVTPLLVPAVLVIFGLMLLRRSN